MKRETAFKHLVSLLILIAFAIVVGTQIRETQTISLFYSIAMIVIIWFK